MMFGYGLSVREEGFVLCKDNQKIQEREGGIRENESTGKDSYQLLSNAYCERMGVKSGVGTQ